MVDPCPTTADQHISIRPFDSMTPSQTSVYHTTARSNLASISKHGLLGYREHSYRSPIEQFVKDTLSELDISLPVDRQRAVYCWPSIHQFSIPRDTTVLLELDFSELDLPVYAADFHIGTDVVCGYEESHILHGVPPEENSQLKADVRAYADSVRNIHSMADVRAANDTYEYAELLVPEHIPVTAIKSIRGEAAASDTGSKPSI